MPKKISDLQVDNSPADSDLIPYSHGASGADRGVNFGGLKEIFAERDYVDDKASLLAIGAINVKDSDYGAMVDGVTDDTAAWKSAIAYAKANSLNIFQPDGVSMISETLYIPSNIKIFGTGKTKSIIRAVPDTVFDRVTPLSFEGMQEKYNYRCMIATESADENSGVDDVENVDIEHIGIDWNDCPGGDYSISPIIAGRCKNVHFHKIKIFGALASDLPEQSVTRFHGFSILFAFAEDSSINHSWIEYADYESVAVRYLSKRVSSYKNTYYIDKPQTDAGNQSHHTQLARPTHLADELEGQFGESKPGPYFCDDNKFYNVRGSNSVATSHAGKGFYCRRNYVKTLPASFNYLSYVFKPFDGTEEFEIKDNIIDLTEGNIGFNDTINTDDKLISNNPVKNGLVDNNRIYLKLTRTDHPSLEDRGIFSGKNNEDKNVTYSNNKVYLTEYNNQPYNVFRTRGSGNDIIGNKLFLGTATETITAAGITFIKTFSLSDFEWTRNKAIGGDIGNGILKTAGTVLERGILDGNNFNTAQGVIIDDISESEANLINNIGVINHNELQKGTFTPEVEIGGTAQDISTKSGTYQRFGDRVQIELSFFKSGWAKDGTGNIVITGLPFEASSSPAGGFAGVTVFNMYTGDYCFGEVEAAGSVINLKKTGSNQSENVTDSDIGASGTFLLRITATYRI